MIVYPPCKINLGLRVIRKRPDHFHDLETVFIPVPIHDILEIIPRPAGMKDTLHSFSQSGMQIAGDQQNNLCLKAWKLLKQHIPSLPEVQMHLHKQIPSGAGLGGGSADGAYTLRSLNEFFKLHLEQETLLAYAAELGSDCPFFILDKPCYATGRGEILEPISLDLSGFSIMIVNPGIHIDTGHAFLSVQPAASGKDIRQILAGPITHWKEELINDFEVPVCRDHPEIGNIRNELYSAGAVYAAMTGSGSSVYGLFPAEMSIRLNWPEKYFSWTGPAQQ